MTPDPADMMAVVRVVKVVSPASSVVITVTATGSEIVVVTVVEELSEVVVSVSERVP